MIGEAEKKAVREFSLRLFDSCAFIDSLVDRKMIFKDDLNKLLTDLNIDNI